MAKKAKIIEVIEIENVKGKGTPDDPIRSMIEYWTVDGKKIAEKLRMKHRCGKNN